VHGTGLTLDTQDPLKHPIPCCPHVALTLTGVWVGQQNSFHLLLKLEQPRSRSDERNLSVFKPLNLQSKKNLDLQT
jgi:hypothetical protein